MSTFRIPKAFVVLLGITLLFAAAWARADSRAGEERGGELAASEQAAYDDDVYICTFIALENADAGNDGARGEAKDGRPADGLKLSLSIADPTTTIKEGEDRWTTFQDNCQPRELSLEFRNVSGAPFQLDTYYLTERLLSFEVIGPERESVKTKPYGREGRGAPATGRDFPTLKPGGTWTAKVHFPGVFRRKAYGLLQPGDYQIRAVYESGPDSPKAWYVRETAREAYRGRWQGGKVKSNAVTLKVAPSGDAEANKGATIKVTAVDAAGNPLQGETWFLLEAKAGRIFTPMSPEWPALLTTRPERVKGSQCAFGELPAGAYSIDVLQVRPSWEEFAVFGREMLGKSLKEMREIASSMTAEVVYHAGPEQIVLKAGETKELRLPPGNHRSEVTVRISEDPSLDPEQILRRPERDSDYQGMGFAHIVAVSRTPGRLLWLNNRFMGLEDHRFGRFSENWLTYWTIVVSGQQCRLKNFPPGDYALFAGTGGLDPNTKSPAIIFRGAKVEIREGLKKTVTIPWREPDKPEGSPRALYGALSALFTTVPIESRSYTVPELCDLLTTKAGAAEFAAAPTLRERSVTLSQSNPSIWELLERLHLEQHWSLEVQGRRFTLTEMK